jgi:N-acetylmuramoyl-L-alanine amidase
MLLQTGLSFAQNARPKKIIIIDAGHGGWDIGAKGEISQNEKDITLEVAREILLLNQSILENSFDLYLTRYKDQYVSLTNRSKLVNNLQADLFVSIHCNTSKSESKGMEVFVYNSETKNTKKHLRLSISLANEVSNQLSEKLYLKNRGVKYANFQVLRETISTCPGILVETGFLSNKIEANYLNQKPNTRAIALVILLAINNQLNRKI